MSSRAFGAGGVSSTDPIFINPLQAPDGTAAAPGYTFSADTTAGVYRPGTGTLGLSARGLAATVFNVPASAVNYLNVTASATGVAVQVMPAGTDTNIPMVVGPKGTGSIQAQLTDGASSGGNARGANAVDWQTIRSSANMAATGAQSVIAGGQNNLANSVNATISGGLSNIANAAQATVSGGTTNTSSGVGATVSGGNTNVSSGTGAVISGGYNNLSSSSLGWVPGGWHGSTRGVYGRGAWASGNIAATGDAQSGEHVLRRQTTDATPTRVTADNTAASTINTINLPNFSAYAGVIIISAKAAGGTDAAFWIRFIGAVRGANAASTTIMAGFTSLPTASNGTGSVWVADVAADTTNGGIAVTVTGAAATTINWTARFVSAESVTAS